MRSLPPAEQHVPGAHTFGPLGIGQSWDADWLTTASRVVASGPSSAGVQGVET